MTKPEMKRYVVNGEVTISVSVIVYAEDEEEARKAAEESPMMGLCHSCAEGREAGEWRTSGELDGSPTITEVEEDVRHKPSNSL